jgi:DNA-binding response OmpR family regulator
MARILILEDEADIAELYRREFEDRGHQVLGIFDDPEDVLKPCDEAAGRPAPELIVLDERLGSISGVKYLPQFRKAFPSARIVVVSADPDAVDWSLAHGADGAARKPVLLQRLAESIESVLLKNKE